MRWAGWQKMKIIMADVVLQLRPTSPFRPKGLVDDAIRLLLEHPQADSVRGVVPSGQNPYKMWRIAENGSMQPLLEVKGIKEAYNTPRQDLPDTYWQTGHIDAIRPRAILEKGSNERGCDHAPVYRSDLHGGY